MPTMDGYNASKQIRMRSNNKKSNTPIIALTATSLDENYIIEVKKSGFNDVISKPFKPDPLLEKINNILLKTENIIS